MRGSKYAPPSLAIRTASTIRSGSELFKQYASAPAANAASTSSSRSIIVTMTTRVEGSSARTRLVSVTPSSAGIPMSITATSGCSRTIVSQPDTPSAASATTSNDGCSAVRRPALVSA